MKILTITCCWRGKCCSIMSKWSWMGSTQVGTGMIHQNFIILISFHGIQLIVASSDSSVSGGDVLCWWSRQHFGSSSVMGVQKKVGAKHDGFHNIKGRTRLRRKKELLNNLVGRNVYLRLFRSRLTWTWIYHGLFPYSCVPTYGPYFMAEGRYEPTRPFQVQVDLDLDFTRDFSVHARDYLGLIPAMNFFIFYGHHTPSFIQCHSDLQFSEILKQVTYNFRKYLSKRRR